MKKPMPTEAMRQDILAQRLRLNQCEAQLDQADFLAEFLPKAKLLIGIAFVWRRSCYSCPEKPSDYWDVFRRVKDCITDIKSSSVQLIFEEVQIDSYGSPKIQISSVYSGYGKREGFGDGWRKCTSREYEAMKSEVLKQIANPRIMRTRIKVGNSK